MKKMKIVKEKKGIVDKKSLMIGFTIGACISFWSLIIMRLLGYI